MEGQLTFEFEPRKIIKGYPRASLERKTTIYINAVLSGSVERILWKAERWLDE